MHGQVASDKIHWFEEFCRNAGLKVTPQRIAVYKVLMDSQDHPSADTVHKRVRKVYPAISLDTVNRTLLTFSEIGAAFVVEGSGEVRRYDADMTDHQHFKCVKCKRIIDFRHAPFNNIEVPETIKDKFTILRKTVYFEGFCEKCRAELEDESQVK